MQDETVCFLRVVIHRHVERIRQVEIPVLAIRLVEAMRGVEGRAILDGVQLIALEARYRIGALIGIVVVLRRAVLAGLRVVTDVRLLRVVRDGLL